MLLFLGAHLALGHLGNRGEPSAERIWIAFAAGFASLSSLLWPLWRGLSWAEVREAAGLRWQGGALRLAWMSATSYACALPCMGAGILLGMLLADMLGGRSFQDVSHPVQDLLPSADGGLRLALFALASVGAPIVEEIAFRGLLYGHARQQSSGWPRALSIAFAMLFSATVFAAIHPQGVLAVPALAGVSLGFCITREWSGSVVPGMVAHGLHNGLLLALNLALQAG
jgi:membrane protease YdiL (CAAX protease family)